MAAVFDSLFFNRFVERARSYWGAAQAGSVSEALASVLGLVLLCQTRRDLLLVTFLVFGDISFAFDCVSRDDMRLAAFRAGITGSAWYIIDDLLSMDHARICLGGLISDAFQLDGGIAQGRKISTLLFNGPMRFLYDLLTANRCGVQFETSRIVASQYIDDIAAPADSHSQCCRVIKSFEEFTTSYFDSEAPSVSSYTYLGVLLDSNLCFQPALQRILAIGYDAIESYLGALSSVGLPMPFQAMYVPSRVASQLLYGVEFCICVESAETQLNRMQAHWAKRILGIHSLRQGAWAIVTTECGWSLRLGTEMLLRAIMLKARCRLLHTGHLVRILLDAYSSHCGTTWLACVKSIQQRRDFPREIPDITDVFEKDLLDTATTNKPSRKRLLRIYRQRYVLPTLKEYDIAAFSRVSSNSKWPYSIFEPIPSPLPPLLLQLPWSQDTWAHYRTWACVRAMGRWPLVLYHAGDLPRLLPVCPLCGRPGVDIRHALQFCPGTYQFFVSWALVIGYDPAERQTLPWSLFKLDIFGGRLGNRTCNPIIAQARIHFVGQVVAAVAGALGCAAHVPDPIEEALQVALQEALQEE